MSEGMLWFFLIFADHLFFASIILSVIAFLVMTWADLLEGVEVKLSDLIIRVCLCIFPFGNLVQFVIGVARLGMRFWSVAKDITVFRGNE